MPSSTSTTKLSAALARAQSKFTKLGKDKTGREGNLSFKYVQLPDVLSMVRPLLNAEGIYLSQPLVRGEDGFLRQTTKVQLADEWDQSDGVPIPALTPGKEMGKTITYARRIDLMPFLGISGEDEDEDAPDLKPSSPITTFRKPINTPEQVKQVVSEKVNPEITDADLPPFGDTNREPVVKLSPEDAALIDELSSFVPLSEGRNREIQNQLKEWVKNKTFSLRSLTTYLDKEHGGKKQFDVSAQQWEQTFSKISSAVDAGSDSIKQLLKG